MVALVNVGGIWKKGLPYAKSNDTWKLAKSAWAKSEDTWKNWFLQGGLSDGQFAMDPEALNKFTTNTKLGANDTVKAIAVESDGKIIVGGAFTNFNGITANQIVRLNQDGTINAAFAAAVSNAFDNSVSTVAVQADGKIIVGGLFTTFNGVTVNRIARLNTDGSLDTAFAANTGTGVDAELIKIKIQPDGKILIGGNFDLFNGTTVGHFARLNSNGTLDTAFTANNGTGATGQVRAIGIQSNGSIVISGGFTGFNGTTGRIARISSNGTFDSSFRTTVGTGPNGSGNDIGIQPDDKIVFVGSFPSFSGTTIANIVRLNSNGSLDTAFIANLGAGTVGTIFSLAIQSDGKIVIGGAFTTLSPVFVNRIARINSDGFRDDSFTENAPGGANNTVLSIVAQPDDKLFIGGQFTVFDDNSTSIRIAKLYSNGRLEDQAGFNATVLKIAIQPDGKVIVGGNFFLFNGVTVNGIARINSDGTLDTVFTTNNGLILNSSAIAIAIQADGKIIIGGAFTTFNGVTVNRIARINSDGTPDTSFTANAGTGANGTINAIVIDSDGKIVVGGQFTTFNGATANRIVRLNSNGTTDTAFTANVGTGASSFVNAIAIRSDNKIVVAGSFITFNGISTTRIIGLNSDGTRDTVFTSNTGTGANGTISALEIQSNGSIILGGGFTTFNGTTVNRIARLNSNGTLDTAFTTNTGTGLNGSVSAIATQPDSNIIIGGSFTDFNGVTANNVVRLSPSGTLDTAFTTNTVAGVNGSVSAIATQPDSNIIIGGSFTTFNQLIASRIIRLSGDFAG